MKIYVASSWRNIIQPGIVTMLRRSGHEVYDFRNPAPGNNGFSWRSIHPDWENWTPQQYREALEHPIAKEGFAYDMNALRDCDACVLVLPSGRSASFEFGWAIGNGKRGAVVMFEKCEPELMYLGNPILTTPDELFDWAGMPKGEELLSEPVTRIEPCESWGKWTLDVRVKGERVPFTSDYRCIVDRYAEIINAVAQSSAADKQRIATLQAENERLTRELAVFAPELPTCKSD